VRGELSVSCAYPTFLCRGGAACADPDPDKPFKINRVPANANNCSCLASRTKRPAKLPVNSDWRVSRLVFCVVLPSPFAYMQRGIGANNNNICIGINITICAMVVPFVHEIRLTPNFAGGAILRRSNANEMNMHYVIPSNRVARLGAAICGRGNSLRNFNSICSIFSLEPKRGVVHLGLPFDCAARRWARCQTIVRVWYLA
jgi:hypothetical protein